MNKKLRISSLALLVATCSLQLKALDYTWNPGLDTSGNTTLMGGDGVWGTDSSWWNGTENIQAGNLTAGTEFGNNSSTIENASLNFYNTGEIRVTGTIHFATTNTTATFPVHTLNFAEGSNYTIYSTGAQGIIGSRVAFSYASIMRYNVKPTAVVNFGGGEAYTQLYSYSSNASQGTIFYGGGTINLNDRAVVRNAYEITRLTIRDGTTVNFNTGSLFIADASGGVLSNPSQYSRISLEAGTLNIDGGTLYTGYRGGAQDNAGRSGISIGNVSNSEAAPAVLNLKSGTLVAIGDPRDGSQPRSAGINIGGTSVNNNGGTFNMTGGELITTSIRGHGKSAIVNLDGGTIFVSTDVPSTDSAVTDENIQTRLDNFISNLNTTTRKVNLGETGARIDTGRIDTTKTDGIAKVNAHLYNMDGVNGTLTKAGANSLLINGNILYTGSTNIEEGTLILGTANATNGALANLNRNAQINISQSAVLDVSIHNDNGGYAVTNATQVINGSGTIKGNVVASGGIFTPNGTLTIDGNFTANEGASFSFNDLANDVIRATGTLALDSGIEIDLSNATLSTGTYTLFTSDVSEGLSGSLDTDNFTGYDEDAWVLSDFENTGSSFSITVAAIPEPSTYALIIALGMTVFLIHRRKNHS